MLPPRQRLFGRILMAGLHASGLHRTDTERGGKDRLSETLYGGRLRWALSGGSAVGVTGFWSTYSKPVDKQDLVRYRFDFHGSKNTVAGFDCRFVFRNVSLSGEIARSRSGGWACLGSGIVDLGKMDLALLFRRFDADFHNPHANGFDSDEAQNREGVYFGFAGKLTPATRISLYYDFFRRPWRTYTIPVPTLGDDWFLEIEQRLKPGTEFVFRTRFRRSDSIHDAVTQAGLATQTLQTRHHRTFRFECRHKASPGLHFRTRIETATVFTPAVRGEMACASRREGGFLVYQDLRVTPIPGLNISARWITFDTDSYDSRIYAFESGLPGVLTIKPLYGRGSRWYVLVAWKIKKHLSLSVKFSTSVHEGVSAWGSGHDQYAGDTDRTLGIHADLKW